VPDDEVAAVEEDRLIRVSSEKSRLRCSQRDWTMPTRASAKVREVVAEDVRGGTKSASKIRGGWPEFPAAASA
jgi:hypothetical protein